MVGHHCVLVDAAGADGEVAHIVGVYLACRLEPDVHFFVVARREGWHCCCSGCRQGIGCSDGRGIDGVGPKGGAENIGCGGASEFGGTDTLARLLEVSLDHIVGIRVVAGGIVVC